MHTFEKKLLFLDVCLFTSCCRLNTIWWMK